MSKSTRRRFLGRATAGVTASALYASTHTRAAGANERVRIGVIGCGNQGESHIESLTSLKKDADLVYVCDVDAERLANGVVLSGRVAQPINDLRRILDDKTIDAVTIAIPDHWHAPAALLALEADKHVYVEKPFAHNHRESQMLVAATRKHGKTVQHGTQSRSSPGMNQAIDMLREGVIGDVLIAKCWNWQRRKNIGHSRPTEPPSNVDYDTWVGPAPWMPYQANRFHYDWHWWFNFGSGGMGNDGIHELDYALWGLGVTSHPSVVSACGGKFHFDDDQQFPDTQQVTFEFPHDGSIGSRRMLIYEQRLWSTSYPFNVDAGAEFYGTKGRMFLSKRGKIDVRGERNQPTDVKLDYSTKVKVAEHQQNWIDCIRSGGQPNANCDIGHRTATAVHLGNIATRLQRTLNFDAKRETITADEEANVMLRRNYRQGGHWSVPSGV